MAGPKGQALLRAGKTELEAEGGVLRTTDEYVDALINYKIRRLVRKHALAASALAGTGASGAALLGLLLQALARLSRAGPGRTTTSAPPDRPPLKARPPGASEEEEAARRSSAPYGGGGEGGKGGLGAAALHGLGRLIGSGPGVVLGATLACALAVMRSPPEGRPRRDLPASGDARRA